MNSNGKYKPALVDCGHHGRDAEESCRWLLTFRSNQIQDMDPQRCYSGGVYDAEIRTS